MTDNHTSRRNAPYSDYNASSEERYEGEGTIPLSRASEAPDMYEKALADPAPKVKGKVVLEYGNGVRRIRPPLTKLMEQNSKIAWYCFREEVPSIAYIWWDKRHPPIFPALLIGMVVSAVIAAGWTYLLPLIGNIEAIPHTQYNAIIIYIFTIVSALTSLLASLTMFILGTIDIFKTRKQFKGLDNVRRESFLKTVLSFAKISLFYGPLFVIFAIIRLFFGLIDFAGAVARAEQR